MFIQITEWDFVALDAIERFALIQEGNERVVLVCLKNENQPLRVDKAYQKSVISIIKEKTISR